MAARTIFDTRVLIFCFFFASRNKRVVQYTLQRNSPTFSTKLRTNVAQTTSSIKLMYKVSNRSKFGANVIAARGSGAHLHLSGQFKYVEGKNPLPRDRRDVGNLGYTVYLPI